jgi:hypothetical protein
VLCHGLGLRWTIEFTKGVPNSQHLGGMDIAWKQAVTVRTQLEEMIMPAKKSARELIDTGTDKRYVRRNDDGTFKESDDVGRSLAQDVKKHAKTVVKAGQGDKGDQKPRKSK